jgi:predicted nucleic acid-binding protein
MVLSEPARPRPNSGVVDWLGAQVQWDLAVSVLTFGEIQRGVDRMADGRRRSELQNWLSSPLREQFADRVLPIDLDVALAWGTLTTESERIGRPLHIVDGLLLATAKVHGLTMVTRNVNDFSQRGVPIHNPFVSESP